MKRILGLASVAAIAALTSAANAQHVNLELSLLVDISGSIDTADFNLQRQGYANAFSNANFFSSTIGAGNSIAVNFIEWSGNGQQQQVVGWTLINNQAAANAFAAAILAAPRPFSGQTSPGQAINFATPRFFNNSFTSDKQVMDVSGDGPENVESNAFVIAARNAAIAAGIDQINGLVINDAAAPGTFAWYQNHIQAGAGSFVMQANSFAQFSDAIQEKIHLEVSQAIPLPGIAGMAGLGLGLVAVRRRRTA